MRLAILDLGTNTFHLLIADVNEQGGKRNIFKSRRTIKLGEGAIHKNVIGALPYERGQIAMREYASIIRSYKTDKVYGFATSAIRSATNGKQFILEVFRNTGLRIEIISGLREAELIYKGVKQCVSLCDEEIPVKRNGPFEVRFEGRSVVGNSEGSMNRCKFQITNT